MSVAHTNEISRRTLLGTAAIGAASVAWPGCATSGSPAHARRSSNAVRQSIAYWCYETLGWSVAETVRAASDLGCDSVELVPPSKWNVIRDAGLTCAIAPNGMPGAPFVKGINNPAYHDEVIGRTKAAMDACAQRAGFCRQVIAFTGYKYRDAEDPASGEISREEGADHCVKALRELGAHGAKPGVTVAVEMLNTRDDSHPMKGHPGYQGDDIDYVAHIVQRVNMPNVRLLFDIYHVQIMNGDLIRRIRQYAGLISHVHVAGNPGRGELHLQQEIGYRSIVTALVEAGYRGCVGHEFIPVGDPMTGLRRAVSICTV